MSSTLQAATFRTSRRRDPTYSDLIARLRDILLGPRSGDCKNFAQAIHFHAQPSRRPETGVPDIMISTLFGFDPRYLPKHTNLFNAELGRLLEKLMIEIVAHACPDIIDARPATMKALAREAETLRRSGVTIPDPTSPRQSDFPKWKKADFILWENTIIECKYRFNSYDSKLKQIRIGSLYQYLGYRPIFLHLSSDFRHKEAFEQAGWQVYSGSDMIDFIESITGLRLDRVFADLRMHPDVRNEMEGAQRTLENRHKQALWHNYRDAPDPIRHDFARRLSLEPDSLEALASALEDGPATPLDPDRLRARACEISARALERPPDQRYRDLIAAFETLDVTARAELLDILRKRDT